MGGRDNLPARHHLWSETSFPTPPGGKRRTRPGGEATGAPTPCLDDGRRPFVPPALHLRKPGQSLGEPQHLTPPPAPFYRPLHDLPHPEAAGPTPGGGQANSDWQETAPPLRGTRRGRLSSPALDTPTLFRRPRPFLFHRFFRLSVAPDSGLLRGKGEGNLGLASGATSSADAT